MQPDIIWKTKQFFRFTGPPEHWLTAVKYMTWGLEVKYQERWRGIESGDIFFIHSTGSNSSAFNNATSGIIGLGVIGPEFSIKNSPLWYYEHEHHVNKWPLLVPLSEIYLFSELPPPESWDSPLSANRQETERLIDTLLGNAIPLRNIQGFPQMGSFSSVSLDVARQILLDKKPLILYSGESYQTDQLITDQEPRLKKVTSSEETARYADTLSVFDSVQARVIKEPTSKYVRDNDLLERAERVHQTILQQLIDLFNSKGYDTLSSSRVDLFAHNGQRAYLFDAKSTENRNFRRQARKGLAQLLEYDYFEISKFTQENKINFKEKYKIIALSKEPKDDRYVEFLNSLTIGIALPDKTTLKPIGEDFGFSRV
jgi:hypothetical protein